MHRASCIALFAAIVLASPLRAQDVPANDEEAAVIAAMLDTMFVARPNLFEDGHAPLKQIVIMDTTDAELRLEFPDGPSVRDKLEKAPTGMPRELIDAYLAANANPARVHLIPGLHTAQTLISDSAVRRIFASGPKDGWERFGATYPEARGIVVLSRIGFDKKHERALLYVGNQYGSLAGVGYYVVMRRTKRGWVVDRGAPAWIS